jgi:hypothetical protein
MEDELSPKVKQAVEEHLQHCEECKNSYENGEGFFDRISEMENPAVPSTTDDKVLLRLKLNRLKWITLVLVGIILSMTLTDYKNEREKMFIAITEYYQSIDHLPDMIQTVKDKEYGDLEWIRQEVYKFSEARIELEEHFNFIENNRLRDAEYHLILESNHFIKMLEVMQYRFDNEMWNETDEAAYQLVGNYLEDHSKVVSADYNEMHHGYSSYLETVNIVEYEQFYKKMNELSDSYIRYHKLPEQLQLLKETELKQIISKTLDISPKKIKLQKESPLNYNDYTYRIQITDYFYGLIDAITGQILELHGSTQLSDDPLMSKENAEVAAKNWIQKIYGDSLEYDLVSLGTNYNFSSNDSRFKVYSYEVVPIVNGYRLYTPLENGTLLHLDARTGELEMFSHNHYVPSFAGMNEIDFTINVPIEVLQEKKQEFKIQETVVIYSALSGQFELVHMNRSAKDFEEGKFYSTKTGIEEWIYFNER